MPLLFSPENDVLKWCARNNCRNSMLMTCQYFALASSSDWLCWREICCNQSVHVVVDTCHISVWKFCAHFSDIFLWRNQWWHGENVFSGKKQMKSSPFWCNMYTALHSLTDKVACTVTLKSKLALVSGFQCNKKCIVLHSTDSHLVV